MIVENNQRFTKTLGLYVVYSKNNSKNLFIIYIFIFFINLHN